MPVAEVPRDSILPVHTYSGDSHQSNTESFVRRVPSICRGTFSAASFGASILLQEKQAWCGQTGGRKRRQTVEELAAIHHGTSVRVFHNQLCHHDATDCVASVTATEMSACV
jgi:hypothetical protein